MSRFAWNVTLLLWSVFVFSQCVVGTATFFTHRDIGMPANSPSDIPILLWISCTSEVSMKNSQLESSEVPAAGPLPLTSVQGPKAAGEQTKAGCLGPVLSTTVAPGVSPRSARVSGKVQSAPQPRCAEQQAAPRCLYALRTEGGALCRQTHNEVPTLPELHNPCEKTRA